MWSVGNRKPYREALNTVAHFLKRLAHCGNFFVTAILDGNLRPDSKRASIKHKAEREIAKINSFFCRQSALALSSQDVEANKEKLKNLTQLPKNWNLILRSQAFLHHLLPILSLVFVKSAHLTKILSTMVRLMIKLSNQCIKLIFF